MNLLIASLFINKILFLSLSLFLSILLGQGDDYEHSDHWRTISCSLYSFLISILFFLFICLSTLFDCYYSIPIQYQLHYSFYLLFVLLPLLLCFYCYCMVTEPLAWQSIVDGNLKLVWNWGKWNAFFDTNIWDCKQGKKFRWNIDSRSFILIVNLNLNFNLN